VWATVAIPVSYFESVWKLRNPDAAAPPKPEELQVVKEEVIAVVENLVEPLLIRGVDRAQNTYKHVRVFALDSLPAPTIEPPSTASRALAWTGQYWNTLAMLGVAFFSLIVLRSVVRNVPPKSASPAAPMTAPTLSLHADEEFTPTGREESDESPARPRLRLKKGTSLKDELADIVREDPDAAAEILRGWIGKAG
jgi:flagellar M-ring protein FliF